MNKEPKPWKTISSRTILDHERLQVTEDVVELPNGKKSMYVRHAPAKTDSVAVIAINADGQVLLQQEYSYPPNKVLWQLPGGAMEAHESVTEAALRELAEESGYSAHTTEIVGSFYIHNRLSDKKQHVVVCTDVFEHKLPEDHDEFIRSEWVSKDEIIKNIGKGVYENINLLAALNIWLCRNN